MDSQPTNKKYVTYIFRECFKMSLFLDWCRVACFTCEIILQAIFTTILKIIFHNFYVFSTCTIVQGFFVLWCYWPTFWEYNMQSTILSVTALYLWCIQSTEDMLATCHFVEQFKIQMSAGEALLQAAMFSDIIGQII